MSRPTTVLITGANRGIGQGLLTQYLSRPNTTVVACVRNPLSASKIFDNIAKGPGSSLITIKLDSTSAVDAASALSELQIKYRITQIDVVIANAGIADYYGSAADTPIAELQAHLAVNTVGVLMLFQAVWRLLKSAEGSWPKFVVLSSSVASISSADQIPLAATAYGASKAATNYIVRKIHQENEWLIAFPVNPGWVQTDMGNAAATANGLQAAPNTLEESVRGILDVIDNATREATSGQFMSFDRVPIPW